MIEIEYCWCDGDLEKALRDAADFVAKLREEQVHYICPRRDDQLGWFIDIVWQRYK